jgi:hypothetical protein
VIREAIGQAELHAEFARRLPFPCEIVICPGREITRVSHEGHWLPGTLDRHFGVPVTTRNWNTMTAIARVLAASKR